MNQLLEKIQKVTSNSTIQYSEVESFISSIIENIESNEITSETIEIINRNLSPDFLNNTLQGHSIKKPYGYAGDFEIIEKLYTRHTSPDTRFKVWDEYVHNLEACIAVRNRKDYFKQEISKTLEVKNQIKLLNIASGPARDLQEMFVEKKPDNSMDVTCIDMDKHAIAYAKNVTSEFSEHIEFINKNIFRFQTEDKYDVIWSAGLFDYFDDKKFVHILRRFRNWLKPNGEIIIGNFNSDHNPSRKFMEIFADWFLIHRSENQLIDLAIQAGFNKEHITVGREDQNINLFLHIKI